MRLEVLERQRTLWTKEFARAWYCRFAFFFAFGMMQPTLPIYLHSLGSDSAQIGLILAVFTVVATFVKPLAGYLMGRIGIRQYLLIALAIFALAPLGYALAWSIPMLVLFRVIHGAAWGGCPPASLTIASNVVPKAQRGEGLGTFLVSGNAAQALAAALGVWILTSVGSTMLFTGVALSGGFAFVMALLLPRSVDSDEGAPRPKVSADQYLKSFGDRSSLAQVLPVFTSYFALGGVTAFLPLQAVQQGLANPGLYFTTYAAVIILCRPIMGNVSDRLGPNKLVVPAFAGLMLTMALLAWVPTWHWFFVAAIVHGFSHGTLQSVLIAVHVDRAPADRRGAALTQWSFGVELGISAGAALLGFVLSLSGENYTWLYATCIFVLLCGMATYFWLSPRQVANVAAD